MFGKKDAAGADIFTLEGDRSPESLTQGTRLSKKLTTIFMIVCAVILGLFLGWRYLSHVAEKRRLAEEEATKADTTKKVEQSLPALTVPPPPALPAPPSAPVTVTSPQTGTQSGPKAQQYTPPPPPAPQKKEPTPQELAFQRKLQSSVMFPIQGNIAVAAAGTDEDESQRHTSSEDSLSQELIGTATPMAHARSLGDRNFLLTKGTFIEAVMETAMSTDVPGMIKALVTAHVYSANGRVVLLERGTRLVGEFRGQLRNGQARVFCLWTRAETPQGIIINLDSGSADALGRSGMDGYVDNHWGLRLGSALLLSTWSDVLQAAIDSQRNTNGDNNYITYDNSSRAAQDMANEALRQYVNIPPTLLKNQGDLIRVFVARDLDFRRVYRLGLRTDASPELTLIPTTDPVVVPVSTSD